MEVGERMKQEGGMEGVAEGGKEMEGKRQGQEKTLPLHVRVHVYILCHALRPNTLDTHSHKHKQSTNTHYIVQVHTVMYIYIYVYIKFTEISLS